MAQKPEAGKLPCLFCGSVYASAEKLTTHLDVAHQNWVKIVLDRLGLPSPASYPIEEYRRALAEAFVAGAQQVALS